MKEVLVWGYYNEEPGYKGNLGDQFFIEAFTKLFPDYHFTFTNHITRNQLEGKDAVFLGGGSFLDVQPAFSLATFELLQTKKLFYLGVGVETEIHPWHRTLMSKAQLIATRSHLFEKVKEINPNVIYCPDLIYSLADQVSFAPKIPKSVLVLPNAYVISKWDSPAWKQNSWESFKSEFAQVIELLLDQKYRVDFFPMCQSSRISDDYAAVEILNKTHKRQNHIVNLSSHTFADVVKMCSSYEMIISQRYHGLVLAEMANVPCLNIWHHDKLKDFSGRHVVSIPYYGLHKSLVINEFDDLQFVHQLHPEPIAIKTDSFEELKKQTVALL